MFMNYMPRSSGSLVMTIKPKTKGSFCATTMLLHYIIPKYCLDKCCTFFNIYYQTSFHDPEVSGTNVSPADVGMSSNDIKFIPTFMKINLLVQTLIWGTQRHHGNMPMFLPFYEGKYAYTAMFS